MELNEKFTNSSFAVDEKQMQKAQLFTTVA